MNMQKESQELTAAEKFAARLQELAEQGRIESLSITINSCDGDELFMMAKEIGINELTVATHYIA